MPAERVAMRQVREIIRLKSAGVSGHEIARSSGLEHLFSRRSVPGRLHPWARAGSRRFPGDPSQAFALLQDPGRAQDLAVRRGQSHRSTARARRGLGGRRIRHILGSQRVSQCAKLRNTEAVCQTRQTSKVSRGHRPPPAPPSPRRYQSRQLFDGSINSGPHYGVRAS
jgi:hypothetical protein